MNWKDILKQKEERFDIFISDPENNIVIFEYIEPNKFELSEHGNDDFDDIMEESPNSPLIPFFKKFGEYKPRLGAGATKATRQATKEEIESEAKSMNLKIKYNTDNYLEDYEDPEEYQQWIAENQFYEQQRR